MEHLSRKEHAQRQPRCTTNPATVRIPTIETTSKLADLLFNGETSSVITPIPDAQTQLRVLRGIETILSQGRFTSTYKFALLIALTKIAVERGSDDGSELEIPLQEIAKHYLEIYWSMARPYRIGGEPLKQNTDRPARIITLIDEAARTPKSQHFRRLVRQDSLKKLIRSTVKTLKTDVLARLQNIGPGILSEQFLYSFPLDKGAARIEAICLKRGIASSLRQLQGIIVALVQTRWARWVRDNNEGLSNESKLEEFLFGASRTNVSVYAPNFYDLQSGRCFLTGAKLASPDSGEVDHFIPWARYPFDSPFNLSLVSKKINNQLRDQLKPQSSMELWLSRNDLHSIALVNDFGALAEDQSTARRIATWAYASSTSVPAPGDLDFLKCADASPGRE